LIPSKLEKHVQYFEHFVDFFYIDYDDVHVPVFSQSIKGNGKEWFRHLQPESISSWDELKDSFSEFFG
jgi:hypothetical protein